ncbi:MAG TPA: DNA repair protein RecO [Gemmatimonadales bacterium]
MAGLPQLTPAIVLGSVRYGETSRIARLLTRDLGMVSGIAKGALRPKSRFGAALQLLSEGHAHLIASRASDLYTLAAFDLIATHRGLASHLERFGAASALAEIAMHFVPPVPNAELYDHVLDDVRLLEAVPPEAIAVVALRAIWRLIAELGIGPSVVACARDGAALPARGGAAFSLRDGGFLCDACAATGATTRLESSDRHDLVSLLTADAELPFLDDRRTAAHKRLLLRWVREHLGDSVMPALAAWCAR